MMKRTMMLAAMASLTMLTGAMAADLAVKAPAPIPASAFQFNGSGFFAGLYTEGGGGSVSAQVPGVSSASLTTTTAAIGLTAGWQFKTNTPFSYTIEADVGATNFNGNNAGFALSGPLSFEQRAMIWAPASTLANALSFLNLSTNVFGNIPVLNPGGFTVSSQMWGLGAGAYWKDVTLAYQGAGANKVWSVAPSIVVAMQDQLTNGTAIRASFETSFPDKGAIFGAKGSSAVLGPDMRARLSFLF